MNYYIELEYVEIEYETQKAILFEFKSFRAWIPKALIGGLSEQPNFVHIWKDFKITKLPLLDKSDICDMFEDISVKAEIIEEPDFSEIVKESKLRFPTPFD